MMKHISVACLALLFATPSMAVGVRMTAEKLEKALNNSFSNEADRIAVAKVYTQYAEKNKDGYVELGDFVNICHGAGLFITEKLEECKKFAKAAVSSTDTYLLRDACAAKGLGECIKFGSMPDHPRPATDAVAMNLAKEYLRVKKGVANPTCLVRAKENKVLCGSGLFDDLNKASKNWTFQFTAITGSAARSAMNNTIQSIICQDMYNGSKPLNNNAVANIKQRTCKVSSDTCKKISASMKMINSAYYAEFVNNTCNMDFAFVEDSADLRNDFGKSVDGMYFLDNKFQDGSSFEAMLREYLAQSTGYDPLHVMCEAGTREYKKGGNRTDDIKACCIGDKCVDFVVDSANAKFKVVSDFNIKKSVCQVQGGELKWGVGSCRPIGKNFCDKMAALQWMNPTTKVRWNNGVCEMEVKSFNFAVEREAFLKVSYEMGLNSGQAELYLLKPTVKTDTQKYAWIFKGNGNPPATPKDIGQVSSAQQVAGASYAKEAKMSPAPQQEQKTPTCADKRDTAEGKACCRVSNDVATWDDRNQRCVCVNGGTFEFDAKTAKCVTCEDRRTTDEGKACCELERQGAATWTGNLCRCGNGGLFQYKNTDSPVCEVMEMAPSRDPKELMQMALESSKKDTGVPALAGPERQVPVFEEPKKGGKKK